MRDYAAAAPGGVQQAPPAAFAGGASGLRGALGVIVTVRFMLEFDQAKAIAEWVRERDAL